jgi:hypothetical protein
METLRANMSSSWVALQWAKSGESLHPGIDDDNSPEDLAGAP